MHRRNVSLKQKYFSCQPTFELWGLRLLCNAGVWETLSTLDFGDRDQYAAFSWLKPLRQEINWTIAVYSNEVFLRTGRPTDGRFDCHQGQLCSENDSSCSEHTREEEIPADKRIAYLHHRLDSTLDELDDLLECDFRNASPTKIGEFWKLFCKSPTVRKVCSGSIPSSLLKALEAAEKSITDEIDCLSQPCRENFREIRKVFNLSDLETRLFAFLLSATCRDDDVEVIVRNFDYSKNTFELIIDLAAIALNADRSEVKTCLSFQSALMRSGLISLAAGTSDKLCERIHFLDDEKFHSLLSVRFPVEKLLLSVVKKSPAPTLTLENYVHLPIVERILVPFLREALSKQRTATNILLYGMPGTGKTELTRAVAHAVSASLYEVSVNEGIERQISDRLTLWKTASSFLSSTPHTMLAIDEAEDVFNSGCEAFFLPFDNKPMRTNKGEINKLLETNPVPTIWITNSIRAIDPAMIRRFNLVIEVTSPDIQGRRRIIENTFGQSLSASACERLIQTQHLAPAVLTQACEVAEMVGFGEGGINEDDVLAMINETLRAQRFGSIPEKTVALPEIYDPSFVNTDMDLMELARGLRQTGGGRLCLYGPPGTGKSAYAAWLARELGRPLMRKTVAELSSCWVGETEKLIAETFRQAQRDNAVLLLDEADSFLRDRSLSRASWETTQVNEMLTQIESFSGYFIATTNLLDTLDPASLRRFDLKAKFDFMTSEQSLKLAREHLQAVGLQLDEESSAALRHWNALTPGDFAAVMRQSRFRPLASAADFVSRLAEELKVKGHSATRKIGFC